MAPPELTILPMGWSRALHLCQCVSEAVLTRARMAPEQHVRVHSLGVRLGPRLPSAGAAYVDIYLVAGCQRAKVQAVAQKASFAGLDLDGHEHSVRVSARRAWRFRCAIEGPLWRPRVRGALLESIPGHFAWAMLLKMRSLAMFDAVYPFSEAAKGKAP
ncbi:unnamed protein product, partial [Prorocentrum cordatum]